MDPLAQQDPRGCQGSRAVLELRVLKARQDPPAAEERRESLGALGTLQWWALLVKGSKERREMQGLQGPEELPE